MKKVLKNLFQGNDSEQKQCVVSNLISPGAYEVKSQSGQFYKVESEQYWRNGSLVVVQQGRIVCDASRVVTLKVYEV